MSIAELSKRMPVTRVSDHTPGLQFICLTCAVAGLSSNNTLLLKRFGRTRRIEAPAEAEPVARTRVEQVMMEDSGPEFWALSIRSGGGSPNLPYVG